MLLNQHHHHQNHEPNFLYVKDLPHDQRLDGHQYLIDFVVMNHLQRYLQETDNLAKYGKLMYFGDPVKTQNRHVDNDSVEIIVYK